MNKKWFSEPQGSIDLGRFVLYIYWYALIGFLIFPVIFWMLLGLESLKFI